MSFLKLLVGAPERKPAVSDMHDSMDPKWARTTSGRFHRLLSIALDLRPLNGHGGVYVIWHQGVKPGWVHAAATDDLSRALGEARDAPEVLAYEARGGLYVTWSPVLSKYRAGVTVYLRNAMNPVLEHALPGDANSAGAEPIPVKMPT